MENIFGKFSVEEINLMCIYSTKSRDSLLNDLCSSVAGINDTDMLEIVQSAIEKLEGMSDTEFREIGLYAADDFETKEE